MKRYVVVVSQTAEKELHRLPVRTIEKVVAVLESLQDIPRPPSCKKLKGYKNLWRTQAHKAEL
jgi:mRNA-degrading endonuclease RelE of RelBE toxin-antitoxin system